MGMSYWVRNASAMSKTSGLPRSFASLQRPPQNLPLGDRDVLLGHRSCCARPWRLQCTAFDRCSANTIRHDRNGRFVRKQLGMGPLPDPIGSDAELAWGAVNAPTVIKNPVP